MCRQPAAYGFYPPTEQECMKLINSFSLPISTQRTCIAGMVPHAGWVYSGEIAYNVIQHIAQNKNIDTLIFLGAAHRSFEPKFPVYAKGKWKTPFGTIDINESLASQIIDHCEDLVAENPHAHSQEHSIEVNVPFVQHLFSKNITIVPILVPPTQTVIAFGQKLSSIVASADNIGIIASADLSHYGPNYGCIDHGTGRKAHEFVREYLDRPFIDAVTSLDAETALSLTFSTHCSCGGGAVSAMISCLKQMNVAAGTCIGQTTSAEIMNEQDPLNFVGYAGVIF